MDHQLCGHVQLLQDCKEDRTQLSDALCEGFCMQLLAGAAA
jgi:hypothetical protein